MNTFKTIVVVGTLLCVGYGAHVIMNKPISNQPLAIADRVWNDVMAEPPDVNVNPELDNSLVSGLPPLGPQQTSNSPLGVPNQLPAPESFSPAAGTNSSPPAEVASGLTPPLASTVTQPAQLQPIPPDRSSIPAGSEMATPASGISPPIQTVSSSQPTDGPAAAPSAQPWNSGPGPSSWSSGFEEMWDSVQLKLQSGQLVDALLAVSFFYNDDGLTNEQRDRMINLLDQLAGTVIYAKDFHREPAYEVKPGESLQSIAAAYQVPAELISRINGVTEATLQPGQNLKVLRGPFRGELSVENRELTLFLGRYYAGRFSVGVGRDLPAQAGTLEIVEKAGAKAFVDRRTGQEVPAGSPENPYGAFWIGLRDSATTDYAFLGLHGAGAAVDASDTRGCISVSDEDAHDLQAILSIGSKISMLR